jgi:phage antirepressor YoqD-like protein
MSELVICNTSVRRDESGRYCLNDLHRASGGSPHHQPAKFFANKGSQDLVEEIRGNSPNLEGSPVVSMPGASGGTFVAKELVYAYAMWISPSFHLAVIRAYDGMTTAKPIALDDPAALRAALLGYTEKVMALQGQVQALEPKAQALDRIASLDGSMCITDAAKSMGLKPSVLFAKLQVLGWIFKRVGSGWIGYQSRIQSGDLIHVTHDVNGEVRSSVRVTAQGLTKLAKKLAAESGGNGA